MDIGRIAAIAIVVRGLLFTMLISATTDSERVCRILSSYYTVVKVVASGFHVSSIFTAPQHCAILGVVFQSRPFC